MTKRVLLAGLLGGVAMFVWSSLAHMVLPLGKAGIGEIPNEQAALGALQASLGQSSGLYFYPAMGTGADATMEGYARKVAANPSGILVYHPPGAANLTMGRLATEFLTEVVEALLAAYLLSLTRLGSFGSRLGFVVVVGVVAAITTNISYWNWYGFPTSYTTSYMITQIVGFLCAGLVAGAMLKAPQMATVRAAA